MKKYLYSCLLSMTLIASVVHQTEAKTTNNNWYNNFYLRTDIGASLPTKKFKSKGQNDLYLPKKLNKSGIYNIGIGYRITDNIRSDLNLSYRNFKYKANKNNQTVGNGNLNNKFSQQIKSYSIFLNGYYDFININKIAKPYLTTGIGYGKNKSKDLIHISTLTANNGTTVAQDRDVYKGSTQNNFIWNAGLGSRFVINDRFNLDLSYKYVNLGKTKTKRIAGNDAVPSAQKITAHGSYSRCYN